METNHIEAYRTALAVQLGVSEQHISLFGKGRQGLYALLRALEIGEGDEVILPAFTCVVVPNAVLYAGAHPVYVDIEACTFNASVEKIEAALTPNTKAIIVQNTFGLSPDFDPIIELAHRRGIFVIEDCAHGFGGQYKGQANGTLGDAAFFSTQWNKPFSTGLGGFVYVKASHLAKAMREKESKLQAPSRLFEWSLRMQLLARKYLLRPALYWPLLKLYRKLSKWSIVSGSSESAELVSTEMPENYLRAFGESQAREGLRALSNFDELLAHRQKVAAFYDYLFRSLDLPRPHVPSYASHGWLRYPFLVKEREKFLRKAEQERIPIGDWMRSPLHPVSSNWAQWKYPYGQYPIGEYLSAHVLNLLTDTDITEKQLTRIADFIRKNAHDLMPLPQVLQGKPVQCVQLEEAGIG
ncbi:MAG TPA: hypothetical protein ENJ88_04570 [Phaeodactylibacter sp.]|nr:hypothetical protein [Phaeodactylibacter sp.]